MKINSTGLYTQTQQKKASKGNLPSFGSTYEINGDTILTRQQVFTMGMLMNNFWMQDARNTFHDIKLRQVYGKFNIRVNDTRDQIVEKILDSNRIEYKKLDNWY